MIIGGLLTLWLLPPVVNIGFSLNLKRLPQILALVAGLGLAGFTYFSTGTIHGPLFDGFYMGLILYVFGHLGLSFALAAVLATPGCEMRSIPQLIGILSGRGAKEHHCPGFMDNIDAWERKEFKKSG